MLYDDLLNHLKQLPSKSSQIQGLFNYLLNNTQYDYPTLENCNFSSSGLLFYIDDNFNPADDTARQNAIQFLRNKGYSEEFLSRVLKHYGEEFVVPAKPKRIKMGNLNNAESEHASFQTVPERISYRTFSSALSMTKPCVVYEDGIIKKGVCADFSKFIKEICNELDIPCETIEGTTSPLVSHVWNLIDLGDGFRHYDLTYAIYSRDKFKNWGSVGSNSWFGITTETLLQMHPDRKIDAGYLNRYDLNQETSK